MFCVCSGMIACCVAGDAGASVPVRPWLDVELRAGYFPLLMEGSFGWRFSRLPTMMGRNRASFMVRGLAGGRDQPVFCGQNLSRVTCGRIDLVCSGMVGSFYGKPEELGLDGCGRGSCGRSCSVWVCLPVPDYPAGDQGVAMGHAGAWRRAGGCESVVDAWRVCRLSYRGGL